MVVLDEFENICCVYLIVEVRFYEVERVCDEMLVNYCNLFFGYNCLEEDLNEIC